MSVPMYPGLTDDEQATVIAAVRDVVVRHAGAGAGAAGMPSSR
jgi:hypothetical protein